MLRATREVDQQIVLIKTTVSEHPSSIEIARLKHEYEMTQTLRGKKRIIQSYALVPFSHRIALVLENVEGSLLHLLIKSQDIDIKKRLMIAIEIAKAIQDIHRANVIHKDIQPQNIMVSPDINSIHVIDLSLSTRLEREIVSTKYPKPTEGFFTYISPELILQPFF